jgi:hypothetical protein
MWHDFLLTDLTRESFQTAAVRMGNLSWRLLVFPRGQTPGFLAAYIVLDNAAELGDETIWVHVAMALVHPGGTLSDVHAATAKYTTVTPDWGWRRFKQLEPAPLQQLTIRAWFDPVDVPAFGMQRPSVGCVGIATPGKTAYLSTLMQLLYHTPALARAILHSDHGTVPAARNVCLALK